MSDSSSWKTMDAAIAMLEKAHGAKCVQRLGKAKAMRVAVISTGVLSFDAALGVGGVPRGRVIEIYGPEAGGKTTLALQIIAQAHATGGMAAFVDAEHALDPKYARALGVNVDDLLISQPDCGEQALEITEGLIRTNVLDVLVVDSVAALVPRAELDGEFGDSVTGDTPVWIENRHGLLDLLPIEDLYGGTFKFFGKRYSNRYKKTKRIRVLTHKGWAPLECVFLKKNVTAKTIIGTRTAYGFTKTTADHSLFIKQREVSPNELIVGDVLDCCAPILSRELVPCSERIAWLLGYFCADGCLSPNNQVQIGGIEKRLIDKSEVIGVEELGVRTFRSEEDRSLPRQRFYKVVFSPRDNITPLFSACYSSRSSFKKVPDLILNATRKIQRAFLDGFLDGDGSNRTGGFAAHSTSFVLTAGIQWLMDREAITGFLSVDKRDCFAFTLGTNVSGHERWARNEIKEFVPLPAPEYLYDLQTAAGTFVGGCGYIVHHNSQMGLQARLMSQAMRKLCGATSKSKTCLIFINQLREKIGVVFGNPEVTTGGRALKFYSSQRIEVRKGQPIKDGDRVIGSLNKFKVVKNKVAAPFCEAEVELLYGRGYSQIHDLLHLASDHGIIEKSGSWYAFKGERIGQGKEQAVAFLEGNPEIAQKIFTDTRVLVMPPTDEAPTTKEK
jgi:RecA/RadA recombinase